MIIVKNTCKNYGYIYLTINLINGKKYVGQHIFKNFDKTYKGSGVLLERSFQKYGRENFKLQLIQYCYSQKELDWFESYWIEKLKTHESNGGYNLLFGGGNYGLHSTSSKKLMSEKAKGENNPFYGKSHTSEHMLKLQKINSSRILSDDEKKYLSRINSGENSPSWGKKLTIEQKEHLSEKLSGSNCHQFNVPRTDKEKQRIRCGVEKTVKSIEQLDLQNNIINVFPSQSEAARITGENQTSISLCCHEKQSRTAGNFRWRFINAN